MSQPMDHAVHHIGAWPDPVCQEEIRRLNPLERRFVVRTLRQLSPLLYENLEHFHRDLVAALADASPAMFRSIVAQLSQHEEPQRKAGEHRVR